MICKRGKNKIMVSHWVILEPLKKSVIRLQINLQNICICLARRSCFLLLFVYFWRESEKCMIKSTFISQLPTWCISKVKKTWRTKFGDGKRWTPEVKWWSSILFFSFNTIRVGSESSAPKGIATLVMQIFCHDKNNCSHTIDFFWIR